MPTIAITNRALSIESIELGPVTKSAKSFDLTIENHKMQKVWLRECRKGRDQSPALLAIAGGIYAS